MSLLSEHGGPFALGATVDLGPTRTVGAVPAVEDHEFDPEQCEQVAGPDPLRLWERISEDAELSLIDVFGQDLCRKGRGAVVPVGAGKASLGTLDPGYRPRLLMEDKSKIRCEVTDPSLGELNLSVTDLRLHREGNHEWMVNAAAVEAARRDLKADVATLLSVGLAEPWSPPSHSEPMHWLQVNNIHRQP